MTDRPSGRAARDADFAAYLQARQASVLRTAYLLSGDRHTAEDLTQTAFAKLYLAWDRVRDQGSIDGYLRRILINSLWRRGWKRREHVTDDLPEPGAPQPLELGTVALHGAAVEAAAGRSPSAAGAGWRPGSAWPPPSRSSCRRENGLVLGATSLSPDGPGSAAGVTDQPEPPPSLAP